MWQATRCAGYPDKVYRQIMQFYKKSGGFGLLPQPREMKPVIVE